jgi:hypothetical protein
MRGGAYEAIENEPYMIRGDHPSLLAAYGFLPETPLIDREAMRRTLCLIIEKWDWNSTWGWDYPLIAMTAARLGETELAVDILLADAPKNHFLGSGHNYQKPLRLPLYLPGNGALLASVALMAGGWDGAPDVDAPGFPKNSQWVVKCEGLQRYI